jgi:glutamyl-tRNA synthetase
MTVVTRFAPSPTGFLHIGGGRTALFNWLYARRHGGTFLLRIEDTDRARSTEAATQAILDGLKWLGLDWDGEPVSQFERSPRHAEVARQMVGAGKAYYCYASPEELEAMRAEQKEKGLPQRYDGRWRDRPASDAPAGAKPVIRLKAPLVGETVLQDQVQGEVRVQNAQLDDMILLRSDGTPTYMLAVVVDDHDMGVTHVIRGDDHLTNTFRQIQIYNAMGWDVPVMSHIPLIHGADGAKLSKRHGALGVEAYQEMGYLPEALRNYLLRLGWAHGNDEIIPTEQAVAWFNLEGIGRSPSRFDFTKLDNLNAHYLREMADAALVDLIAPRLTALTGGGSISAGQKNLLASAMPALKQRAKTLKDLSESAVFFIKSRPLPLDDGAQKILSPEGRTLLAELAIKLKGLTVFSASEIEEAARQLATDHGLKLGQTAQPLRAALSGSNVSPPIFEVAALLGRDETVGRIEDALK